MTVISQIAKILLFILYFIFTQLIIQRLADIRSGGFMKHQQWFLNSLFNTLLILSLVFFVSGWQAVFATDMNRAANCNIVPLARFGDDGETTAVGLTTNTSSGLVRWIFYDQNGLLLASGAKAVTQNRYNAFVMSSEVGANLSGDIGFLLFCLDSNSDGSIDSDDVVGLSANAFQVEITEQDVAYLPTIPVFRSNLDAFSRENNFSEWQSMPVVNLSVGANSGDVIELQYLINGDTGSGEKSTFYIFSVDEPDSSDTMVLVGPGGQTITFPVALTKDHLNIVSVESIEGINNTSAVGSGLAYWAVTSDPRDSFAFSIVKSPAFGATQTLLGNILPDN